MGKVWDFPPPDRVSRHSINALLTLWPEKTDATLDGYEWRVPGSSTLSRPLPAQRATSPALVGLLTSEFGRPAFSSSGRQLCRRVLRDNGQEIGQTFKHSVTAAGAVPDSHRVPCMSALSQKWPTTNAPIERH